MFRSCQIIIRELCSLLKLCYSVHNSIRICKRLPGVFPGGKGGPCVRLTTYHHPVPLSRNLGTFYFLEPFGPVQACNGTDLSLPLLAQEKIKMKAKKI